MISCHIKPYISLSIKIYGFKMLKAYILLSTSMHIVLTSRTSQYQDMLLYR